jgi:hypothetical protein
VDSITAVEFPQQNAPYRQSQAFPQNQAKLHQQLEERRARLEKFLAAGPRPDERDDILRQIDSITRELGGEPRILSEVAEVDVVKAREMELSVELGELYRALSVPSTGLCELDTEEHRRILEQVKVKRAELTALAKAYSFFSQPAAPAPRPKKAKSVRKSPYRRRAVQVPEAVAARVDAIKLEASLLKEGITMSDLERGDESIVTDEVATAVA